MKRKAIISFVLLIMVSTCGILKASQWDSRKRNINSKFEIFLPEFSASPEIDGKIEESAWKDAAVIKRFGV